MSTISDNLLNGIQLLIDKSIQQLKFDKTVQAEIVNLVNNLTGEYKVKYNGNTFSAFATNLSANYTVGDVILLKIPEGDLSNKKTIEGKANELANTTSNATIATDLVVDGSEIIPISIDSTLGINSNKHQDTAVIAQDENSLINQTVLSYYQPTYQYFKIQATLRTKFLIQKEEIGNYGLRIYVNSSESYLSLDWRNSGNTNPFALDDREIKLSCVFKTNATEIQSIDKIELFYDDGLSVIEDANDNDIFCSMFSFQFVDVISIADYPLYLQLRYDTAGSLVSYLYSNGTLLSDKSWDAQWFAQDNSCIYQNLAFPALADVQNRWKIIEGATAHTFMPPVVSYTTRYRLAATYKEEVRTATIEIPATFSLDLHLRQNGNQVFIDGLDKGKTMLCDWYVSLSDGTYRPIKRQISINEIVDISSYLHFSSMQFYCDVWSEGQLVAQLESSYNQSDTAESEFSFIGDTTIKFDASGRLTEEEAQKGRRIKCVVGQKDNLPGSYTIEWIAPDGTNLSSDSMMLNYDASMLTNVSQDIDGTLYFSVRSTYDPINRYNNTITAIVKTPNETYTLKKEIGFLVDNNAGTNGTLNTATINFCDKTGQVLNGLHFLTSDNTLYLKAQAFYNEEEIDIQDLQFSWSIVGATWYKGETSNRIAIQLNNNDYAMSHYVKCTITFADGTAIHAIKTIDVAAQEPTEEQILSWGNIPSVVQYQTGGRHPIFTSDQLYLLKRDGIQTAATMDFNVKADPYELFTKKNGIGYYCAFPSDISTLEAAVPYIVLNVDGIDIYHTVYCYVNTYGNEDINGWDGSAELSVDNGYILAPLIGAGTKSADNKFSGVLLGRIKDSNNGESRGLYGYKNGEQTFGIDESGNAYFKGKIEASSGKIGGWEITDGAIVNSNVYLSATGTIKSSGWTLSPDGTAFFNEINSATMTNCTIGTGADSSWIINIDGKMAYKWAGWGYYTQNGVEYRFPIFLSTT